MSRLFAALGRGLRALWLGLAHLLGAIVRRIGSTARDLDPEHRRDGLGLGLVGLAVVVSAAEWWRLDGVGRRHDPGGRRRQRRDRRRTSCRSCSCSAAWAVMRRPGTGGPAGRSVIGWSAIALGVLGLIHIEHGLPRPSGGQEAMREAGGAVGYIGSAMIADLFRSTVIAVPLLVLLDLLRRARRHRDAGLPDPGTPAGPSVTRRSDVVRRPADAAEEAVPAEPAPAEPLNRGRRRSRVGSMRSTRRRRPRRTPARTTSSALEALEVNRPPTRPTPTPRARPRPRRRARAAAAHPAAAARRAAQPVRRHRLHAAHRRDPASPAAPTRRPPRPRTPSSSGSPRCSTSSRSTPRSPATPAVRR